LRSRLRNPYQESVYGLRPGVLLDLEASRPIWDAMMQKRNAEAGHAE
jgi:hypothetical protein